MSAKQVSSGYILWKTGPEPIRHSHRERARLLTAAPTGIAESCTDGKFHQAGEYAVVGSMGENRLPQPVRTPKGFPGAVQEEADCPGSACSEEIAGAGQTGGISSEASTWGSSPQTPVQKNTRKVIGPSGCSVM